MSLQPQQIFLAKHRPQDVPLTKRILRAALVALFWLVLWQAAAAFLDLDLLLPSPLSTLEVLLGLVGTAEFWQSILFSLSHIIVGYVLGSVAGLSLAVLAARLPAVKALSQPVVLIIRTIPVASFVILVLIWVRAQDLASVIAALMAFPVVAMAATKGIEEIDIGLLEMAHVFEIPFAQQTKSIYVAALLPYLKVSLSVALGLCWKAGIAAEVIALPNTSIGINLFNAKVYLATPELFAWTVVIVILSFSFDILVRLVLDALEKRWEAAL